MLIPPLPADEAARLAALQECQVLDTEPEEPFDDLARVAASLCQTPVALVSFIDAERQWFKARVGFELPSTARGDAVCNHALSMEEPLVVPDLRHDGRFAESFQADNDYRFYAGVPLRIQDGTAVGTLCVLDRVPRELDPGQLAALTSLAGHVMRELRVRRALALERATVTGATLEAGDVIGDGYRIERELGRGGIGAVFAGRDKRDQRVAIKILLPQWMANDAVFERFAREAQILRTLRSPHNARLLDVGNLQPSRAALPYMVLEYLDGIDVAKALQQRGRIPWREAVAWVADACDGVAEAHAAGIVHRDLKPANVFLAREAERTVVKVLDYGIAKTELSPTHAPLTAVGELLGSLWYMPPEQVTNTSDVQPSSDVWSLGVMLYELLSGRVPFEGNSLLQMCMAITLHAPMPLEVEDVPTPLAALIRRCLKKSREERPRNAAELGKALRAIL